MERKGGKKREGAFVTSFVRSEAGSSDGAIERNCARRTRETGNFTMQIQLPRTWTVPGVARGGSC